MAGSLVRHSRQSPLRGHTDRGSNRVASERTGAVRSGPPVGSAEPTGHGPASTFPRTIAWQFGDFRLPVDSRPWNRPAEMATPPFDADAIRTTVWRRGSDGLVTGC